MDIKYYKYIMDTQDTYMLAPYEEYDHTKISQW